jgi:hypothetical protein
LNLIGYMSFCKKRWDTTDLHSECNTQTEISNFGQGIRYFGKTDFPLTIRSHRLIFLLLPERSDEEEYPKIALTIGSSEI